MLTVKNLNLSYGKNPILNDISFEIGKGDILTVVGPSGCGKSTLLNILGGIIKNYSGHISLNNKDLSQSGIHCGYVPQALGLLPWKKVKDNIFLPFKIDKTMILDSEEAGKVISELGISDLLNRYPSQLSGGQKQRVALARVFTAKPDLLLMDEPFSALDTLTAETSRKLFFEIWKKHRATTIFTTHNLNEAASLGKYILLLSELPARVKYWIENPFFDLDMKEKSKEFYQFVSHLKELMADNTVNEIGKTAMP